MNNVEPGLFTFIKQKLDLGNHLDHIKSSLIKAGFSEEKTSHAISHVIKNKNDTHQDIVASHSFLPPLNKERE